MAIIDFKKQATYTNEEMRDFAEHMFDGLMDIVEHWDEDAAERESERGWVWPFEDYDKLDGIRSTLEEMGYIEDTFKRMGVEIPEKYNGLASKLLHQLHTKYPDYLEGINCDLTNDGLALNTRYGAPICRSAYNLDGLNVTLTLGMAINDQKIRYMVSAVDRSHEIFCSRWQPVLLDAISEFGRVTAVLCGYIPGAISLRVGDKKSPDEVRAELQKLLYEGATFCSPADVHAFVTGSAKPGDNRDKPAASPADEKESD